MMSITSSVAQQYELINELDASLVSGKPAFQAICPFGHDGLQSLAHTEKNCVRVTLWTGLAVRQAENLFGLTT